VTSLVKGPNRISEPLLQPARKLEQLQEGIVEKVLLQTTRLESAGSISYLRGNPS